MRTFNILLMAGATLAFVACGGDGDDPDPTATSSASGGQTTVATQTVAASTATTGAGSSPTRATSPAATSTTAASPVGTIPGGNTTPVVVPPVPTVVAGVALLRDVRIGAHPETSSERIVFEFSGALPQARVEYIASAQQCGSGTDVPVEGGEVLSIRFLDAAAHDSNGQTTFKSQSVSGTGTPVTEAKQFCDFENELAWAAGVTGMQPFVVSQLADPPRLVIDVKR